MEYLSLWNLKSLAKEKDNYIHEIYVLNKKREKIRYYHEGKKTSITILKIEMI